MGYLRFLFLPDHAEDRAGTAIPRANTVVPHCVFFVIAMSDLLGPVRFLFECARSQFPMISLLAPQSQSIGGDQMLGAGR